MLLSASFVAFLSIISIGSTEEEEIFDYGSLQEVGSVEPIGCSELKAVHVDSDYIYVFCLVPYVPQLRAIGYGRYSLYQKQKPFDLLSLILLFDIEQYYGTIDSQLSEVSRCFYIHKFGSKVWRIGIDDQAVTTFLSINFWIHSLAISSNGQLFILVKSRIFSIHIYASDATLIGIIELPNLKGSPSIFHVGGNKILITNYHSRDLCRPNGIWGISNLKYEEGRFIWKDEKEKHLQKILGIGLPRTTSQEAISGSSFNYTKWDWVEVTRNNEGMLTYLDPYSNATKNVSKDDCWGELEMSDDPLSSYFYIIRNMIFTCKERIGEDNRFYNYGCNRFHTVKTWEMILMYKCLNETSWCQKILEKVEGVGGRDCLIYVSLHTSESNLFIRSPPISSVYFSPKTLMIYTGK